jgi:hypothetical protein
MRLTASDNKAGVEKLYYSVDGGVERPYKEPFPLVKSEGNHYIKYTAADRVGNTAQDQTSESYANISLDLSTPDIRHAITGAQVVVNDTLYVSAKSLVNITAKDIDSGIKKVGYKINGTRSNPYTEPFLLDTEGINVIEYYALDNVNNRISKEFVAILDVQGPEVQMSFSQNPIGSIKAQDLAKETQVYSLGTFLFLAAKDSHVNVEGIYYSIDNLPERKFEAPIRLAEKGLKSIKVRAVDMLGNEVKAEAVEVFIK